MKRVVLATMLAVACTSPRPPRLPLPPAPDDGALTSPSSAEGARAVILWRASSDPSARQGSAPVGVAAPLATERLREKLKRVEAAMRPVCHPKCGIVALAPEASGGCDLCAEPTIAGTFTTIRIRSGFAVDLDKGPPLQAYLALAHEYGHHLDYTVAGRGREDRWGAELRAEALAGCAVVRASLVSSALVQALRARVKAQQNAPAPTHPGELAHPHEQFLYRARLAGADACTGVTPTVDDIAEATKPVVTAAWLSARRLDH